MRSEPVDRAFANFLAGEVWNKYGAGTLDTAVVNQIEACLKSGANPNVTFDIGAFDDKAVMPLHLSAVIGRKDLVALLLQAGADANRQTASGFTPRALARHLRAQYETTDRSHPTDSPPLQVDYDAVDELLVAHDARQ